MTFGYLWNAVRVQEVLTVQEWVQGSMGIFSRILTEIRTLKIHSAA